MSRNQDSRGALAIGLTLAWLLPLALGAVVVLLRATGWVEAQQRAERGAAGELRDQIVRDVTARLAAANAASGLEFARDAETGRLGPFRVAAPTAPRAFEANYADEVVATLVALGEFACQRGEFGEAAQHFGRALDDGAIGDWAPAVGLAAVRAFAQAGQKAPAFELLEEIAAAHQELWIDLVSVPALCAVMAVRLGEEGVGAESWRARFLVGDLPLDPRSVESLLVALGVASDDPRGQRLLGAAGFAASGALLGLAEIRGGDGVVLVGVEDGLRVFGVEEVAAVVGRVAEELEDETFAVASGPATSACLARAELPAFGVAPRGVLPSTRSRQALTALTAAAVGSLVLGQLAFWWLMRRTWRLARAKSEFVDLVSHELRTPIAALTVKSEMLAGGDVPAGKVATYQRDVHAAARRLGDLVERVLDFARLEKGRLPLERRRITVQCLVAMAVESGCEAVELSGQRLVVEVPRGLPDLDVDTELMARALRNLLDNAARHGKGDDAVVTFAARVAGAGVLLEITDHGPGLGGADPRSLVEPFRRGPRPRTAGSGLGLAIAAQAAQAHGGRLTLAERGPAPGVVSRIWLPAAGGAA